jgi:hypothetical protein
MSLKLVSNRPSKADVETAWHLFAALSHYRRDNRAVRDDAAFTAEMNKAHDRWAELFVASEK